VALRILAAGRFRGPAWGEVGPVFLLLVGVAQTYLSLFGGWSGDLAVLAFIVFFMLELRHVAKGQPTLYALAAITGVTVVVALMMADAEQEFAESKIKSGGQALFWVASQIFRFGTLSEVKPVSASGNVLGIVAIISGVLFAAFLFSAVTAWAVGTTAHESEREMSSTVREAVREALIEAGVIPRQAEEVRQMQRLVIDVDRVVGHEPRTWWSDRGPAIERFVRAAPNDERILHAAQAVECRPALLVSRRSGAWVDQENPDEDMGANLDLIVIDGDINHWIANYLDSSDVVVTGGETNEGAVGASGARLVTVHDFMSGDVQAQVTGP
jgi:hypothetical protein